MPIIVQSPRTDLFESDVDVLVNPVNTQGVMGAGLALQFKQRYPTMFEVYRVRCHAGLVRTGEIDVHVADDTGTGRRVVIANFPTKHDWRGPSRIEWVEDGLAVLARVVVEQGAGSIAIPALGCGLGGLAWALVYGRICETLAPVSDAGVDVLVYPPSPRRQHR